MKYSCCSGTLLAKRDSDVKLGFGKSKTCKYVFKVEGQKADDTFVQVYAPAQKEVPSEPNDPFFSWKKVGKVFMTDKAKSPKAAPSLQKCSSSCCLWKV